MCFSSLRESWESFSDELQESQRQLEVTAVQLSSFEESFDQFQKWSQDTTCSIQLDGDLKGTLQEKKLQLQHHRVCITLS